MAEKAHFLSQFFKYSSVATKSLADDSKNCLLSDFLPYRLEEKKHTNLADGLKEYKMLLIATNQAFTQYLQGHLSSFDSLVGENSCQIRATMIFLIADLPEVEINNLLDEVRYGLEIINNFKSDDSQCKTLKEYLKEKKLHIKLNNREAFLISSYILTQVRDILPPKASKRIVRNESTNIKKIKKISPVGSTFSRELVKKLRHFLSSTSVNFVQEAASLLSIPNSYINMVSDKYIVNHDKFGRLRCLPAFWYTFILMQYSLTIKLPIAFKISRMATDLDYQVINEVSLFFKVVKGKYALTSTNDFSREDPILIILGSCCRKFENFPPLDIWKQEFLQYNPLDLLLAYAAAHRQYPDEEKDILVGNSNCEIFDYYRTKASEIGCSLENPSLFFLVHAYCEKIKNIK